MQNSYTYDQLESMGREAGDNLANAVSLGEKSDDAKTRAKGFRNDAYVSIHGIFESFGLKREDKSHEYKKEDDYKRLLTVVCRAVSRSLGDEVATDKRGVESFTVRVRKQWSRLVTAYRENNEDGTQSSSDKRNKEVYREKQKLAVIKAEMLDTIVQAHKDEEPEIVMSSLLDRAASL